MLTLQINGQQRKLETEDSSTLDVVLKDLGLQADRVAVEWNGEIVSRTAWSSTQIASGDRLEIVHFVGGGLD